MNQAVTATSQEADATLPRAVRERLERANRRRQSQASPEGQEANQPQDAAIADPAPSPAEPQPAPAPTPAEPADPRENDAGYWQHRFKVVNGLLASKETKHREEIGELNRRIAQLEQELAQARSEKKAGAQDIDLEQYFTPEQIEEFGEDHCRTMLAAARKATQQELQQIIDAQIRPILQRDEEERRRSAQSQQERFQREILEAVPEIGSTPEDMDAFDKRTDWLLWLAEEDPNTGIVRQEILERHVRNMSASGVVKMIRQFLAESAPPKTPAPPVVPSGTAASATGLPTSGQEILRPPTDAEIRDFYKRKATIRDKHDPRYVTPEEEKAFEQRLRLRMQR